MMLYDYGADWAERAGDLVSRRFYRLSRHWAESWREERRRMCGR